jgi:hypothetical protein
MRSLFGYVLENSPFPNAADASIAGKHDDHLCLPAVLSAGRQRR